MIKRLLIQNLILIEKAEIFLSEHLNIFTGESGSGKSAVLTAIKLISGERASPSWVQKGKEMAVVEAEFSSNLFIRRELYSSGKSRCFIDDRQVSLAELKELNLLEIVDQNSSILGQEKELLDSFAKISKEVKEYENALSQEKKIKEELNSFEKDQSHLLHLQRDFEELNELQYSSKEEEKLDQELELLSHAQEMNESLLEICVALDAKKDASSLKKAIFTLEKWARLDQKLKTAEDLIRSASLELEEALSFLQSYTNEIQIDPIRLEILETRIGKIEKYKRLFGPDLVAKKKELEEKIDAIFENEQKQKDLQKELEALSKKNLIQKLFLDQERKKAATLLGEQVEKELKELNLSSARFVVKVEEEKVFFLFSANPQGALLSIDKCASGGELARLFLAMKTILSKGLNTLIFDEIDSSIGGQTAKKVAEKLKNLSDCQQVLCVTHFIQVAKYATDHFVVLKKTVQNEAISEVKKINKEEKEVEYDRMLGILC